MADNHVVNLKSAEENWQNNNALEAGRIIFELVPPKDRPTWASHILRIAIEKSGVPFSAGDYVNRIANDTTAWKSAHSVFGQIRRSTLELENIKTRSHDEDVLLRLHLIAELVAKVTYNATNPVDAFDEDSGWWLVSCAKELGDFLRDNHFSQTVWRVICQTESRHKSVNGH